MRKFIKLTLVIALTTSTANAATIGLHWDQWPDQPMGCPGTVNIVISDLLPGDTVGIIAFDIHGSIGASLHSAQPTQAGWNGGAPDGPIVNGTPFAILAQDETFALDDGFSGVAGTFVLFWTPPANGIYREVTFDPAANLAGVRDASGTRFEWDARYSLSYSGYIAYGDFGNPGWGRYVSKGHQPMPSPLFFTDCIPEPTGLALLITGGAVLLRRGHTT